MITEAEFNDFEAILIEGLKVRSPNDYFTNRMFNILDELIYIYKLTGEE